jgi:hypothetical protein
VATGIGTSLEDGDSIFLRNADVIRIQVHPPPQLKTTTTNIVIFTAVITSSRNDSLAENS